MPGLSYFENPGRLFKSILEIRTKPLYDPGPIPIHAGKNGLSEFRDDVAIIAERANQISTMRGGENDDGQCRIEEGQQARQQGFIRRQDKLRASGMIG